MSGLVDSLKIVFPKCSHDMLIPFSIDPDALECIDPDLSVSIAIHRRVINEWRNHGVLVHSVGPLKESTIAKKIEAMPQECRKLWKSAISGSRRRPSSHPWDGLFPNSNLADLAPVSGEFDLALLEPTRAVIVGGLSTHQSSRIEPSLAGMELCKIHAVSESLHFQKAAVVSTRALTIGDNCASEWKQRYAGQISQANYITVVDRYILANHNWRVARGELSGLHRLLDSCFARRKDRQVSINILCAVQLGGTVLSASDQKEINDFLDDLKVRYSGGGIRSLSCHICTDREFAKLAHERYIRMDYAVFGIDAGVDVFGGLLAGKGSVVWRHDISNAAHFTLQEAGLKMNAFQTTQVI